MGRKKGNNYVVDEENGIARIELNRRNADNLWTIIDLEDLERVINFSYTWCAKYNHTNDEYYERLMKTARQARELVLQYPISI